MTDSSAVATNPTIPVRGGWPWRIALVAILTAFADWLFFRQVVGVSLALFVLAVGASVVLANRIEASGRALMIYSGILVVAILPSLEDFNVMSALVAAFGIGCFALGVTAMLRGDLTARFIAVLAFLINAPSRLFRDLPRFERWASQRAAQANLGTVKGWIVPLVLGAIFVALFAAANPVIANWLTQWSTGVSLAQIDALRIIFWVGTILAVWVFVCACDRLALPDPEKSLGEIHPVIHSSPIFNDAVIVRSLVLFNLLFAVQTVMDINYLWRGAALPDGMTYATYAHRGAYPLIATALLAAAFVLAAMRPGSDAERSPLMRALVFVWVGQNVLLVVSAIMRLNLYVETYLLTYWRVAAFIWMLIVATGLILIVVRIVTQRSNAWLIAANLAVVALTIYVCSFVNFASLVANYNVSRGRDTTTAARPVDVTYLASLGPQAIPAIDRYVAAYPVLAGSYLSPRRTQLAADHLGVAANWRAWTFRGWRLSQYLEASKSAPALTPP